MANLITKFSIGESVRHEVRNGDNLIHSEVYTVVSIHVDVNGIKYGCRQQRTENILTFFENDKTLISEDNNEISC